MTEIDPVLKLILPFSATFFSIASSCSIKSFIIVLLRDLMKKVFYTHTYMKREIIFSEL